MFLKIPAFSQSHMTWRISQRLLKSAMGRGVLWDPVPMLSLRIFPAVNMWGKDISGLLVQLFMGPVHPSVLALHAFTLLTGTCNFFSLWQPSCPYRQHKLGKVAGINNFPCISTAAGGLPARRARALSAPCAAIWFCWRFWSLSRVWFMCQEQRHSHWRSRARWLTLPLLKGEVGSHQPRAEF